MSFLFFRLGFFIFKVYVFLDSDLVFGFIFIDIGIYKVWVILGFF